MSVLAAVGVDDGLIAVAVAREVTVGVAVGVVVSVASATGTSVGLLGWHPSNAASTAVESVPARNARREILGRRFMASYCHSKVPYVLPGQTVYVPCCVFHMTCCDYSIAPNTSASSAMRITTPLNASCQ